MDQLVAIVIVFLVFSVGCRCTWVIHLFPNRSPRCHSELLFTYTSTRRHHRPTAVTQYYV